MPPPTSIERAMEAYTEKLLTRWSKDFNKVHRKLDALNPTSRLPPLPSPVRGGAGCKREVNVAFALRYAIEKANAGIPDGQGKYIEFPEGYSDKKLNSDAKDALDLLMVQHIGENYGELTWKTASRTTHKDKCEPVIRQAASSRDFMVFRQTAFLWAIRDLADQKMKSKGRGVAPASHSKATESNKEEGTVSAMQASVADAPSDLTAVGVPNGNVAEVPPTASATANAQDALVVENPAKRSKTVLTTPSSENPESGMVCSTAQVVTTANAFHGHMPISGIGSSRSASRHGTGRGNARGRGRGRGRGRVRGRGRASAGRIQRGRGRGSASGSS